MIVIRAKYKKLIIIVMLIANRIEGVVHLLLHFIVDSLYGLVVWKVLHQIIHNLEHILHGVESHGVRARHPIIGLLRQNILSTLPIYKKIFKKYS